MVRKRERFGMAEKAGNLWLPRDAGLCSDLKKMM
jgi:hypothetical protein